MASVGERIRHERESRNTSLDDMSVATGIGQSYLESLERGEYHELPGPAFGKLYIRAYAEVLGFDPQPWIDDYDREHRHLRGSAEYAAPARTGARPMAEAIARWRESKTAATTSGALVEDETPVVDEPQPEVAAETLVIDETPLPVEMPESEVVREALEVAHEPAKITEAATPLPPAPISLDRFDERSRRFAAPFALVGIVIAILLIAYFAFRGSTSEPVKSAMPVTLPAPSVETAPASPARVPPPSVASPPAATSKPAAQRSEPTVVPISGDLTVTEFGVGRRVVNLTLVDRTDQFTEGDRVNFASRISGGRRGNVIRHVWIYEGHIQQSIALRLGGPDYRTHTNKTVGKAGAWAVEARDDKGRVLARSEFTVVPRSR